MRKGEKERGRRKEEGERKQETRDRQKERINSGDTYIYTFLMVMFDY